MKVLCSKIIVLVCLFSSLGPKKWIKFLFYQYLEKNYEFFYYYNQTKRLRQAKSSVHLLHEEVIVCNQFELIQLICILLINIYARPALIEYIFINAPVLFEYFLKIKQSSLYSFLP